MTTTAWTAFHPLYLEDPTAAMARFDGERQALRAVALRDHVDQLVSDVLLRGWLGVDVDALPEHHEAWGESAWFEDENQWRVLALNAVGVWRDERPEVVAAAERCGDTATEGLVRAIAEYQTLLRLVLAQHDVDPSAVTSVRIGEHAVAVASVIRRDPRPQDIAWELAERLGVSAQDGCVLMRTLEAWRFEVPLYVDEVDTAVAHRAQAPQRVECELMLAAADAGAPGHQRETLELGPAASGWSARIVLTEDLGGWMARIDRMGPGEAPAQVLHLGAHRIELAAGDTEVLDSFDSLGVATTVTLEDA